MSSTKTTRVSVRLPDELLAKTDVAAEVTHKTRTEIVEGAVLKCLEEIEDDESFKEAVIECISRIGSSLWTCKE